MKLREMFENKNLPKILKYMEEISGGYQVYNPLSYPVKAYNRGTLIEKLKNLKYTSENFKDKTVADIGCNLGFFSFYASYLGASKVISYDFNKEYLDFNNEVLNYDSNNLNNYKDKINFIQKDLKFLPAIENTDILLANAILHWFIILNSDLSQNDIIKWMYDSCKETVLIEGCLDWNDPSMVKYGISKERIEINSFINESKKIFSKVEILGYMDYCKTRVMLRLDK